MLGYSIFAASFMQLMRFFSKIVRIFIRISIGTFGFSYVLSIITLILVIFSNDMDAEKTFAGNNTAINTLVLYTLGCKYLGLFMSVFMSLSVLKVHEINEIAKQCYK